MSQRRGSVSFGEKRLAARQTLIDAYLGSLVDNWDGEGAMKVEPSTFIYADQLLNLIQSNTDFLDITVDRDGELFFEWDKERRQVFSISVGRDGTLTYAGLFGHNKIHGTENLDEGLPLVISACLSRISNNQS